jgi:hypothetical protein
MGHMHQPLIDAIAEFAEGYGKDERYKSVLEGLQGAVSGLQSMGPNADGAETPGQLAAKLAAQPDAVPEPKETPEADPNAEAPKNFADATAAAKERIAAAR